MNLDIREFFQATNPDRALFTDNLEKDQNYYINFSSVRGEQTIEQLKQTITYFEPNQSTCQLFTGHVGSGKSTELKKLKLALETDGFFVVYVDSTEDLELTDVDVTDILLTISRKVSQKLKEFNIGEPKILKNMLEKIIDLLKNKFDIDLEVNFSDIKAEASNRGMFSLSLGIAKITAQTKSSSNLREQIREYLEPRTQNIIEAINQELLIPGTQRLKENGKKGLVVIVDNLEKMSSTNRSMQGNPQADLFVDRGTQLRSLDCHVVYTMPLALRFTSDFGALIERFNYPRVLPMVRIKKRNNQEDIEGMKKLKMAILTRAFSQLNENNIQYLSLDEITNYTQYIFDSNETIERLCRVSGGHIRLLLRLLNNAMIQERDLPISSTAVEQVIKFYANEIAIGLSPEEFKLLQYVAENKCLRGDELEQKFIRNLYIYEYRDIDGSWFDVNPLVKEVDEFAQ